MSILKLATCSLPSSFVLFDLPNILPAFLKNFFTLSLLRSSGTCFSKSRNDLHHLYLFLCRRRYKFHMSCRAPLFAGVCAKESHHAAFHQKSTGKSAMISFASGDGSFLCSTILFCAITSCLTTGSLRSYFAISLSAF